MVKALTTEKWADIAGLTKEDLLTQMDVAIEEAIEALESVVSPNLRLAIDAAVDFNWMADMAQHLSKGGVDLSERKDRVISALVKCHGEDILKYFDAAKEDVLKSNFSKFCDNKEDVDATIEKYNAIGIKVTVVSNMDLWAFKSSDSQTDCNGKYYPKNKVLKAIGYFEPEFNFLE